MKNIILAVLVALLTSLVGVFAYNEYQHQNSDIKAIDAEIQLLEDSVKEKVLRLLEE